MIIQTGLVDIVFSLDSVIVGIVLILSANSISSCIEQHLTIEILAVSFPLLIGVMLIGEALDMYISKGSIYITMGFYFGEEIQNTKKPIT